MPQEVLALPAWAYLKVTWHDGAHRQYVMSGECFSFGRTGGRGALLFRAPKLVDIRYKPMRFCLLVHNTSGISFSLRGQQLPSHEAVQELLYHGDVLAGGGMTLLVESGEAPWELPLLPVWQPPPAPPPVPPTPIPPAPPVPTSLERVLGLQARAGACTPAQPYLLLLACSPHTCCLLACLLAPALRSSAHHSAYPCHAGRGAGGTGGARVLAPADARRIHGAPVNVVQRLFRGRARR